MSKALNDAIFRACADRMVCQGLRGKRRDNATLDFLAGAIAGLYAMDKRDEANHLSMVAAMIIAPRGFAEIERLIRTRAPEATEGEST